MGTRDVGPPAGDTVRSGVCRDQPGGGCQPASAGAGWQDSDDTGRARRKMPARSLQACWIALSLQALGPTGRTNVQYSSNLTGSVRLPSTT